MPLIKTIALACLLCLLLGVAPARAIGPGDSGDPEEIEKKIRQLLITYTEDHPEVMRLREYLRKVKRMKADKEAQERAKDPNQAPAIERDFKSSQSFD